MANQLPVLNAGCFLCGRSGTTLVTTPQPQYSTANGRTFRYECPICGEYEIHSVVCGGMAQTEPHELEDTGFGNDKRPVEMESAAIEHWTKALEVAERQRRLARRPTGPQSRNMDPAASACA
jgi:hypothetical protein